MGIVFDHDNNIISASNGLVTIDQAPTSIEELSDMLIINPTTDDVLIYDANLAKFTNSVYRPLIDQLFDIDLESGVSDSDILAWNDSTQKWIPQQRIPGDAAYELVMKAIGTNVNLEYLGQAYLTLPQGAAIYRAQITANYFGECASWILEWGATFDTIIQLTKTTLINEFGADINVELDETDQVLRLVGTSSGQTEWVAKVTIVESEMINI